MNAIKPNQSILLGVGFWFLLLVPLTLLNGQSNEFCATCHKDSFLTHKYPHIEATDLQINDSVHARFDCVDCHYQGYADYPHYNKFEAKVTCNECHEEASTHYYNSSHYLARRSGNLDAPSCTDCHTIHDVADPLTAMKGKDSIDTCTQCHADQAHNQRFQLKSDVVDSYKTSYHGQMYNLGFEGERYATCVSCHDNHAILPKESADSTIGQAHIKATCAQCHDDVNDNFVGYLTHYSPQEDHNPVLNSATHLMEGLLIGTMSVFGLHTLLWFFITLTQKGKIHEENLTKPIVSVKPVTRTVLRFRLHQRLQHIVLAGTFLLLAFTGLPLKFSDSPTSQWIAQNIVGFESAALLHRISGIIMLVLFAVHIAMIAFLVLFKKRHHLLWGPTSLVPQPRDVKDFFMHMAYFLHIRKSPPRFGRWTYWEKFDYFAVVWGMFAIGLTGLVLMVPLFVTQYLPGWFINMSHIVHSEEALLATAFIFIIHFFNTHLRPHTFPMDDSIFTGRITLEQLKEERPLEYEELQREGRLDSIEAKPLAFWQLVLVRALGFAFLFVGLALLFLIITSLLFH
jgi:cytochrome b subunit of formate dehydrogenase